MNIEQNKVTVTVSMFGRETPVELELDQAVETVADLDKFIQSKKG